mmetsp:Transcript_12599/g.39720  ORF Transcript_12599/g.39720 Transcript_12599/m.39720 type:complete len:256 (-) Transcript_12599:205-972(-)
MPKRARTPPPRGKATPHRARVAHCLLPGRPPRQPHRAPGTGGGRPKGTSPSHGAHLGPGFLLLEGLQRTRVAKGEAEGLHQREAVGLGHAVVEDAHIEAVDQLARVDQLVELPEGLLVLEAHPEVPIVVKGVWVEAFEVADARKDDGVQPVQKIIHQRPPEVHRYATRRPLAPPVRVDVVLCLHHPGVHARNAPHLLNDLVDDLRVCCLLGFQPGLDAHLEETVRVPGLGAIWCELPLQGLQKPRLLGHAVLLHL